MKSAGKTARRAAAQRREQDALIQRQQQQLAEASRRAARGTELEELAAKDKFAAAKALGIDPRELVEQAEKQGTPEYERDQRIRAAEERAERAEKAVQEEKQRQQRTQIEQQGRAIRDAFIKTSSDAALYPNVSKLPEEVRVGWATQIVNQAFAEAQQQGLDWNRVKPTDSRILAYMQKKLAGVPAPSAKAPDTASSPDATQNGSATPQTVTTKVVSAKYTLPANFDSLSDQEQKHHLARYLESIGGGKKKRNG